MPEMNSIPCSYKFHGERNRSVNGEEYRVDVPTWTAKHTAGLKYHLMSGADFMFGLPSGTVMSRFLRWFFASVLVWLPERGKAACFGTEGIFALAPHLLSERVMPSVS